MKKYIIIFLLLSICIANEAQEMNLGLSFLQNYSTFRYIGSDGKKDDLNYAIKFGYGLSFQKVNDKNIFLEGLLLYNHKGAGSNL